MNVLNFLLSLLLLYWLDILVVVVFLAVIVYLVRKNKTDLVKRIILWLVVVAEKELGSKTGQLKKAMVITAVYDNLPGVLRIFFTKQIISDFIDDAAAYLKEQLEKGDVNLLNYYEELDYHDIE